MKNKYTTSYTARGSIFSGFSLICFLLFAVIIPGFLIWFAIHDCSAFLDGRVGALGITKKLVDGGTLKLAAVKIIPTVCYIVSVLMITFTLVLSIYGAWKAHMRRYTFKGNEVVVGRATLLTDFVETRKMFYSPGMSVYVDQSFKGWVFRFGDVIVDSGLGNAGQIVLKNVRFPNKARRHIMDKISQSAYQGFPHGWNVPNMCNYGGMPFMGGMGMGYPFYPLMGGLGLRNVLGSMNPAAQQPNAAIDPANPAAQQNLGAPLPDDYMMTAILPSGIPDINNP